MKYVMAILAVASACVVLLGGVTSLMGGMMPPEASSQAETIIENGGAMTEIGLAAVAAFCWLYARCRQQAKNRCNAGKQSRNPSQFISNAAPTIEFRGAGFGS
jgi:hypothetical protein